MITKIELDMRIIPVKNKVIPFREGSDVRKRAEAVLKGGTVKQALARGARVSTVRHLVKTRHVRLG